MNNPNNKSQPVMKKQWNPSRPLSLRFSPTAWAKLLYFRDQSNNEVGGFGITLPDDLLYVRDFVTVKQKVTCVSVQFDDDAVADFFEDQVVLGRKPEQFARIWCHTHPSGILGPSSTDHETFQRVFGTCQWAVMFILCQDDKTYARLSFNVGPGGQVLIPVQVDYQCPFGASDYQSWQEEFKRNVHAYHIEKHSQDIQEGKQAAIPATLLSELEKLSEDQRQEIAEELAINSSFWDEYEEELFL